MQQKTKNFWQQGTAIELIMLGLVLAISAFLLFLALTNKSGENLAGNQAEDFLANQLPVVKIELPSVLYNLGGKVQAIEGKTIVFEANVSQLDNTGQLSQRQEIRRVQTDSDTRFSRLQLVLDKEKQQQTISENKIAFADIKVGDQIEVIANYNIKNEYEFLAAQVRLRPGN